MLSAATGRRRPGAQYQSPQIAVRSFVSSIEGNSLAMTGINSTHQCPRNVDSTYPPPAKLFCAESHKTDRACARTWNSIVLCVQSSLPSSSTSADICAALHADHLQTQLTKRRRNRRTLNLPESRSHRKGAVLQPECSPGQGLQEVDVPPVASIAVVIVICCPPPASPSTIVPPRLVGVP